MKNLLFASMLILLLGCQKEKIKPIPKVEAISASTGSTVITYQIDNNIKTEVLSGNTETITLNNGVILLRVKDATNPQLFHITKKGAFTTYFNETVSVSGNITTVAIFYTSGVKAFSVDVNQSGNLSNLFADRNIAASCVSRAISTCVHSSICFLMCTAYGWGSCIMGWILGCQTPGV